MPTSFRIDAAHGVVYAETRGPTSSVDLISSIASVIGHPGYVPGLRVLLDMREVVPSLHRADILQIAQYVKGRGEALKGLRVAVVAEADSTYGMAQEQKVAFSGCGVEMEVFRKVSAAREWLGLPAEDGPTAD